MRLIFAFVLLALTALPFAGAGHCAGGSTSTTGTSMIVAPVANFYIVKDICTSPTCVGTAYLYQETGAITGLQRNDSQVNNTCHGLIPSDTRITL